MVKQRPHKLASFHFLWTQHLYNLNTGTLLKSADRNNRKLPGQKCVQNIEHINNRKLPGQKCTQNIERLLHHFNASVNYVTQKYASKLSCKNTSISCAVNINLEST